MNTNALADFLANSVYLFLAINLFWGLYCALIGFRRLWRLRFRTERQQDEFLAELQSRLSQGEIEEAANLCQNNPRALPQLTLLALKNSDLDSGALRALVAERMQRDVISPLDRDVTWILTVVRNGPLLGLFGTVLGMMAAFGRIGEGQKVEPAMIADEISVALICTAMGLGTAIPFGYVAHSLNLRIRDLQEALGPALHRVLEQIKQARSPRRSSGGAPAHAAARTRGT